MKTIAFFGAIALAVLTGSANAALVKGTCKSSNGDWHKLECYIGWNEASDAAVWAYLRGHCKITQPVVEFALTQTIWVDNFAPHYGPHQITSYNNVFCPEAQWKWVSEIAIRELGTSTIGPFIEYTAQGSTLTFSCGM